MTTSNISSSTNGSAIWIGASYHAAHPAKNAPSPIARSTIGTLRGESRGRSGRRRLRLKRNHDRLLAVTGSA